MEQPFDSAGGGSYPSGGKVFNVLGAVVDKH